MILILHTYFGMLLKALGYTMLLTLLALLFAMLIGLIFALMNVSRNRIFNFIGTVYVDAIRGVPMIVLAFFIYFGVPQGIKLLGAANFRLTALQAGTIALAMNCGAYMAEIFRGGIESIDKGSQPQPGAFVCKKHALCGAAAGIPRYDSFHNKSVYHHP